MLDDMTVVYQRHVSSTDVDALIAFYSSPAASICSMRSRSS